MSGCSPVVEKGIIEIRGREALRQARNRLVFPRQRFVFLSTDVRFIVLNPNYPGKQPRIIAGLN